MADYKPSIWNGKITSLINELNCSEAIYIPKKKYRQCRNKKKYGNYCSKHKKEK